MKQSEIRFSYYIDSSLDLDEILEYLINQTCDSKGILMYFSLEKDDLLEIEYSLDKIKKQTLDLYYERYNDLEIEFKDIQILISEDSIEINSSKKLDLEEFDAEEKEI